MTTITIADVGTQSEYTLEGSVLTMQVSGGCTDVLAGGAVALTEDMTDEEIETAVWEAWVEDYVGDPVDSRLSVCVSRS